jgi:hypothetical protein
MDPRVNLKGRRLDNVIGKELTDRKIEEYIKRGFYSEEFRQARRDLRNRRGRRDGNFLVFPDGRRVYSPK